jgi:uncharacterized protein YjbJ (UPF0337 family)
VKGIVEDVKGNAKEAAGALAGKDDLRRERRAQQDKASADRDVAAKEAEPEKARATAQSHEAEQRSHQNRVRNREPHARGQPLVRGVVALLEEIFAGDVIAAWSDDLTSWCVP